MKITPLLLLNFAVLLRFAPGALHAETQSHEFRCRCSNEAHLGAPMESSEHRKYAPDRKVDILHTALDVTPDFKQRTIAGKATLTFKPIAKPLEELKLDGLHLAVQSVTSTEKIQAYQVTDKNILVTFETPVPAGREASVTITYSVEPRRGLYFRTPEMGYKPEDTHLWTQGEDIENRHWFPCYDYPNEKFTSEIICHVPEGMVVLSNGKLVSQEKDANGLTAVRWLQDKPHVNYLISLVAGNLRKIEDKYKDIPLAFWTPASEINQASNSFRDTKDMLAFYEQEIGVPYPWVKYDQVAVQDFHWGGMENTSITTLNINTLFTDETENIRSSEPLVAHELAHQWFGDLVTCKDWSHAWLNEGFATYYEKLYAEHKHGRDQLLFALYNDARGILERTAEADQKPMVYRKYDVAMEIFANLIYPKGSWILHMLRNDLGEDLYRNCIKTYLERHKYDTVTTADLSAVIEELSGHSYDQFFDQWCYHAHQPELAVTYSWDEKTRLAKVSIRQTQQLSENIVLFNFPLKVRFKVKGKNVDRMVTIKEKAEDFVFLLEGAPELVRIDPDYALLAKVTFEIPNAMLYKQLEDKADMIGRLLAVEQLSKRKDHESVAKLKQVLNNDGFHGVREEAARALRSIHSEEALEALLASTKQTDARVRNEVTNALGGFYQETAYAAARKTLSEEKNPAIVGRALNSIGGFAKPEVRETLLQYLNSNSSYRNSLVEAAIGAIRLQDDPAFFAPLKDCLQRREAELTTGGFTRGLETLAYLARKDEKKDEARNFLTGFVNHKKERVQVAAINALGTLGDPKAIAVIEKFATAARESPERSAAEKSLAELRAAQKPVDDFKNLRSEVLDLQKQDRKLREELDELKKKLEALQPKSAQGKAKKTTPQTKPEKKEAPPPISPTR